MSEHALQLKDTGRHTRRGMLYTAKCSCGKWTQRDVIAETAASRHVTHLQQLGKDAKA